ncbi:MAG: hypothetical protein C0507_11405 [Cyanobacteria bacterium PR.3.49]|nr:hypothetical protein [Cyanobacteria bacterium PR.3.49]
MGFRLIGNNRGSRLAPWLYGSTMKRFVVSLLLLCTGVFGTVHAQGLIGDTSCPRASEPVPLIQGKSDLERWSNFQTIQPSLIGMSYNQVIKALGQGRGFIKSDEFTLTLRTERDRDCLLYQIARTKIPGKTGSMAPIELTIVFKKNLVQSYLIEAVY